MGRIALVMSAMIGETTGGMAPAIDAFAASPYGEFLSVTMPSRAG